jgi:hypothetical protein
LQAESAYATTNEKGIATFDELRFVAGRSGFYALRFESAVSSSYVRSSLSNTFYVQNPIETVHITRQPFVHADGPGFQDQVRVGNIFGQPIVRVNLDNATATPADAEAQIGENGTSAFAGKRVMVEIVNGHGARIEYTPPLVDDTGTATFTDMRFTRATTAIYQLIFVVDGVPSSPSEGINIVDANQADFSSLDAYQDILPYSIYMVPLLIANSTETPHLFSDFLWQILGIVVAVVFAVVPFVLEEYYKLWYNQNDLGTTLWWTTACACWTMCVLYAKLVCGSVYRHCCAPCCSSDRKPPPRDFTTTRLNCFQSYVRMRLFVKGESETMKTITMIQRREGSKGGRSHCCCIACCARCCSTMGSTIADFIEYMRLKFLDLDPTDGSFFFPQRLQIACVLSFAMVLATQLFCHSLALSMVNSLAGLTLQAAEQEANARVFDSSVNAVANPVAQLFATNTSSNMSFTNLSYNYDYTADNSAFAGTGLGLLSNSSSTAIPPRPNVSADFQSDEKPEAEAVDISGIIAVAPATLLEWQVALRISSVTAVVITMVLVLFVWIDVFSQYKRRMTSIRRGIWTLDRRLYSILNAPNFVGLQVAHMIVGTLLIWFLLTLFLFVLVSPSNRNAAIELAFTLLVAVLGFTFVMRITSRFMARSFIVDRSAHKPSAGSYGNGYEYIIHRHWFALYDYTWVFLGVVSGFFVAMCRLGIAVGSVLYRYIRLDASILDDQLAHLDSGYTAYMGMMLLDHSLNNPVALVFAHLVIEDIEERNQWALQLEDELRAQEESSTDGGKTSEDSSKVNPLFLRRGGADSADHSSIIGSVSTPARFRWLVAYTLLRNRALITDRKMSCNHNGSVPRESPLPVLPPGHGVDKAIAPQRRDGAEGGERGECESAAIATSSPAIVDI